MRARHISYDARYRALFGFVGAFACVFGFTRGFTRSLNRVLTRVFTFVFLVLALALARLKPVRIAIRDCVIGGLRLSSHQPSGRCVRFLDRCDACDHGFDQGVVIRVWHFKRGQFGVTA